MTSIVYGTVSSSMKKGSSHGLSVGVADSNLDRWDVPNALGSWSDAAPTRTEFRAEPGRRFGAYRLIERVGRGRQADVWRALRYEPTIGDVALKILSDPGRDHRRVAQLRREAERGRRLASASLLTSYEFGIAEGLPYMAMPLVVGCTLGQVIGQRRAELRGVRSEGAHRLALMAEPEYTREVVGIIARIARAVNEAHAAQVVHRDIKPGNILLHRDHASGVFLCDFGLGRDLDVATPTQLLDGAGSPLYMAPERLLRRSADEVRCDIYALGVSLFEALTLNLPFNVPHELTRDEWPEYLARAVPTRPSTFRAIPDALEATILRALSRHSADRHPSALAFAEEIESLSLAPEPAEGVRLTQSFPDSRQRSRLRPMILAMNAS